MFFLQINFESWFEGHFAASKYKVSQGITNENEEQKKEKNFGAALTHFGLQTLNNLVVDHLLKEEIPACGMAPFGSWITKKEDKEFDNFQTLKIISKIVKSGMIPVLHGDVTMDEDLTFAILSGDLILKSIAKKFKCKRAVFLTDVFGVYTLPPNEKGSELIPEIKVKENGETDSLPITKNTREHDVTGGTVFVVVSWFLIIL